MNAIRWVLQRLSAALRIALYLRHLIVGCLLVIFVRRRAVPLPGRDAIQNLLVIRLDGLGDWILTSAFLRELRKHYPGARIGVVVSSAVEALTKLCPYIDEYFVYRLRLFPLPIDQIGSWWKAYRFARTFSGRHFDMAIVPRWEIDDPCALGLAYMLDVPVRVGFGPSTTPLKAIKNAGYDRLLTHVVPNGENLHEAACSLQILRYLGAQIDDTRLEAWVSEAELSDARERLRNLWPSRGGAPLIAVAPGASQGHKRWPAEYFRRTIGSLIDNTDAHVVLIGGKEDCAIADEILTRGRCPDCRISSLTGILELRETLAVLRLCDVLIGNDSGPCHMAAAMGTPVVMLSSQVLGGHTVLGHPPERYHPWGVQHRVLRPTAPCAPCTNRCVSTKAHCILGISEAAVEATTIELLEKANSRCDRSA